MVEPLEAREKFPIQGGPSFSVCNRLERLAWSIVWFVFARWTPTFFSPWRIFLLRLFGAKIHRTAAISASAKVWLPRHLTMNEDTTIGPSVDCYNMAPIALGKRTIISQRAVLCAGSHDITDPHFQLVARPITIGEGVWVAAEAFIGPGVTVGDGAVVGARACAFRDLKSQTVYIGNPAIALKARDGRKQWE